MKNLISLFVLMSILSSCRSNKEFVREGYFINIMRLDSTDSFYRYQNIENVNSLFYETFKFKVDSEDMLSKELPFYQVTVGNKAFYVEKKAILKNKRGKLKWKKFKTKD